MNSFKYLILFSLSFLFLINCKENPKKEPADLIIYNAVIYTVDSVFSKAQALSVKDGRIQDTGTNDHIQSKYTASTRIDALEQTIIPGLFDAHAHFHSLGKAMREVDLFGATSYDEILQRVVDFQEKEELEFIVGRGWDQNLWPEKKFPTKDKLDELFPNTPVILVRVDGHALLANQEVLDRAQIDLNSTVEGGTFIKENGKLTGVLIDNAMNKAYATLPEEDEKEMEEAFLSAQEVCFSYGLTMIADAGVSHKEIQLMDKMTGENKLKIGLHPMLIHTDPNLDDYLFNELGENSFVSSTSVKLLSDGALGSRGAALKEAYSDDPHNYGKLLGSPDYINHLAEKIARSEFQLNTHAIGDSANHVVLQAYHKFLPEDTDRRWRIEHAQIVDGEDLGYFNKNIIPSVQPTHAISDMFWAIDRLGENRITYSYPYKELLDQSGLIALGTDAPIEEINPYRTFYAAVARKNEEGKPEEGFQMKNALSREEALKGMTIWAAYAQFDEDKLGSIEPGKQADFVILNQNIMEVPLEEVLHKTKVKATYVKGVKVYDSEKK